MLYTFIIDRVQDVNVFNVVYNQKLTDIEEILEINESLHSTIDIELVDEYLTELDRIAETSCSLLSHFKIDYRNNKFKLHQLNSNQKLKQMGETIFRQFFPETLQKFIKNKSNVALFFHLAKELASLPLELLHDGEHFLWEKFFIGKNIKGRHPHTSELLPKENINMLIVADPSEDLDWARREGEYLFEQLSTDFSEKRLSVQLVGGRSITKLNFLYFLLDMDVIHYCGHLHYGKIPEENGWVLYNNKIIYTHEIKKSGARPLLIFSNSCYSGRRSETHTNQESWYSKFASSFLHSGEASYIGTNWQLPDIEPTIEFTVNFYESLLKGASLGSSLQEARRFAKDKFGFNDLTWASYILIGNPLRKILAEKGSMPSFQKNVLDMEIIFKRYPFPIADSFEYFYRFAYPVNIDSRPEEINNALNALFNLILKTISFLCILLFSYYKYCHSDSEIKLSFGDIEDGLDTTYQILNRFGDEELQFFMPNLRKVLLKYKKKLYQIESFQNIESDSVIKLQSALIAGQFFVENLLMELEFFKNCGFYYIFQRGLKQLSLLGLKKHHVVEDMILPAQLNDDLKNETLNRTSGMLQKCVFYIPLRRVCLDLSNHIHVSFRKTPKSNSRPYVEDLKLVSSPNLSA